jgi:y4mF family transcriptional regulator
MTANGRGDTHDRTGPALAAAVFERRKLLGLRQEDLADLADVSLRFVQLVEAGKPSVRLDKVEAVLSALGLRLTVVPDRRDPS